MGKSAIVVVSFGTTIADSRRETIERFGEYLQNIYPAYDIFYAFTSRIVANRIWKNEGVQIHNEQTIMHHLVAEGYDEVVLQSLHLIPGYEYEKMVQIVMHWNQRGTFRKIKIGRPLLRFIGQEGERPDDYQKLLDILMDSCPKDENAALLLVGHGTKHTAQAVYSALQLKAWTMGLKNMFVTTIEGFPELTETMTELKEKNIRKVILKPLFFVAGDHVLNDIFGDDDDTVSSILKKWGFEVEEDWEVLGNMDAVFGLYEAHIQDALAGKYEEKHKEH